MTTLPNPWLSDSAAPVSHAADTAVAAISPPVAAAGPTDCIHEIFHHARKLIADEPYGVGPCMINDLPIIKAENERMRLQILKHEAEHRFVLDEVAFAEALEEPPLFLRMAQ